MKENWIFSRCNGSPLNDEVVGGNARTRIGELQPMPKSTFGDNNSLDKMRVKVPTKLITFSSKGHYAFKEESYSRPPKRAFSVCTSYGR